MTEGGTWSRSRPVHEMTALPPDSEWPDFCARVGAMVRFDLLTVLEVEWEASLVRRRFSSDELNYPSGGVKRLMDSDWGRHVLRDGLVLRVDGAKAIRATFTDHELILSLGLQHALNAPVTSKGRVAWTLNLLRRAPAFDDREVALAEGLLKSR
jgi:GAF domain-containing protein